MTEPTIKSLQAENATLRALLTEAKELLGRQQHANGNLTYKIQEVLDLSGSYSLSVRVQTSLASGAGPTITTGTSRGKPQTGVMAHSTSAPQSNSWKADDRTNA